MTWWPRPLQTMIGARRFALKSESSEPARMVSEGLWAVVAEALAWAYSVNSAAVTPKR